MSLSDMKVYAEEISGVTIETLDQMVEKFNQASAGTIVLTGQGFEGDFLKQSMFQALHSAQRRVNRYGAQGAETPTDLTQIENVGVKVAGGFGPVRFEPSQLSWIMKNPAQAIEAISRNLAESIMQDQLNTVLLAGVTATENNANVVNDVSGSTGITQVALNGGHAKFGDHSQDIVSQVMTGSVAHRLIGNALANSAQLFTAGSVQVIDILGKISIITDAPALYEAGTPNKDKVLCLVPNALVVNDGSDLITNIETTNGQTRIETTMQADYTFGINVKGYAWDVANGGKSPVDATIATGSNWDKYVTSDKHTAGVLVIGSADA